MKYDPEFYESLEELLLSVYNEIGIFSVHKEDFRKLLEKPINKDINRIEFLKFYNLYAVYDLHSFNFSTNITDPPVFRPRIDHQGYIYSPTNSILDIQKLREVKAFFSDLLGRNPDFISTLNSTCTIDYHTNMNSTMENFTKSVILEKLKSYRFRKDIGYMMFTEQFGDSIHKVYVLNL